MLQELGAHNVSQAGNAREAINLCKSTRFDIIFCDYNLGDGQDGQQILEELNLRGLISCSTLFLMITAETSSAQVLGALEYQPDAYVTKPFTRQQLEQRLKRLLARNIVLKPIHDAINSKSSQKGLLACEEVLEKYPAVRFATLRLKAGLLEELGLSEEALRLFNVVVDEQPLLWAMVGIGRLYFYKKDFENALKYFKETAQQFPSQASVLDWVAKCQHEMGLNAEAESILKDAISISPKNVRRQTQLGEVAQSLSHFDLAHKSYGKAIKEGSYSCIINASHYQHYFDNTAELVKEKQGKERMRLLEDTETSYKRVESMHSKDASKLACTQASVAKIYLNAEKDVQINKYLSKLSKTLARPNCNLDKDSLTHIESTLQALSENTAIAANVQKLSTEFNEKKELYRARSESDQMIEEAEPADARLLNREGMQLAKAKRELEALEKYNQAIAMAPNNHGYRLNAVQVIIENKMLMNNSTFLAEAKEHLKKVSTMDKTDERWTRYLSLNEKMNNA